MEQDNNIDHEDGYEKWFQNTLQVFRNLPDDYQTKTICGLVQGSSCDQRYILLRKILNCLNQDILVLLPPELQEQVCHYIDPKSLMKACCVSKEWRRIILAQENAWKKKCILLNVGVENVAGFSRRDLCFKALRIYEVLNKGVPFLLWTFSPFNSYTGQITAVDYSEEYSVIGADEYISVWKIQECSLVVESNVASRVSCLHFYKSSVIICGHSDGTLTALLFDRKRNHCDIHKKFIGHAGVVLCAAVNTSMGILVSGATDSTAKVWCYRTGKLLQTLQCTHWIIQTTLMPSISNEDKNSLLIRTRDNVQIFTWKLKICSEINRIVLGDFSDIGSTVMSFPLKCENNFFTSGCYIVDDTLYYINQSLVEENVKGNAEIIVQSINKKEVTSKIPLGVKVRKLLAVGKCFALLLLPTTSTRERNLAVVDLRARKLLGGGYVPHSSATTPNLGQIAVCETKWLDGLGFQYPQMPVVCMGLQNGQVLLVEWKNIQP